MKKNREVKPSRHSGAIGLPKNTSNIGDADNMKASDIFDKVFRMLDYVDNKRKRNDT